MGHRLSQNGRPSQKTEPHLQAAFDFMPEEIRQHRRFGGAEGVVAADFRTQSKLVDRQVAGLVSRIAAARLRQVLSPVQPVNDLLPPEMSHETPILPTPTTFPSAEGEERLSSGPAMRGSQKSHEPKSYEPKSYEADMTMLETERATLRDAGVALFYFRDDAAQQPVAAQRLHPRPLPARYYDLTLLPERQNKAA
jgi:hypothetical protein